MRDAKSPFADHITGFLAAKRLADKSRVDYARYLREFDEFTGHVSLEEALTLDNAARWIETVKGRGIFAARNAAHYLKSMATWVAKSRLILIEGGGSRLAGLEAPQAPASSRDAFSDEQLEAIWKALGDRPNRDRARAKAYLWLLVATGLRRNEAKQLAMADLHIDHEKHRSWILVRWQTSKGSKQRKVRLDREAIGPIDEYINKHRPTYSGPANKPEPILHKQARKAVEVALRPWNCQLERPEACEQCNKPCKPEAHHYLGYQREHWLNVWWLCTACHKREHMERAA